MGRTRAPLIARSNADAARTAGWRPPAAQPSAPSRTSPGSDPAPASVEAALGGPGAALDSGTREYMEGRFGYRLSDVRIHTDARAAASARDVHAVAYTVGRDVVFDSGRFAPASADGRRLLAHELTHVVQQGGLARAPGAGGLRVGPSGDSHEREADRVADQVARGAPVVSVHGAAPPTLARANTQETADVLHAGTVAGAGVQFYPLQVTSTRIGPVSGQGGLLLDQRSRLSVILGTGISMRHLCDVLLPLWNSAAPFTPEGGTTPVQSPLLTRDELARGLLVYNRYYLRVLSQPTPSMTGFAGGLRFPLPVEIDANGEGVVNRDLVRMWAGTFEAAWEPLLDQAASAVAVPDAATAQQSATTFLAEHTDTLSQGMSLAVQSITNPVQAQPLVTAVFQQIGAGQLELALTFMDSLVNNQVGLLASQTQGAAILAVIRGALTAAPAQPTAQVQERLDRPRAPYPERRGQGGPSPRGPRRVTGCGCHGPPRFTLGPPPSATATAGRSGRVIMPSAPSTR